LSDGGRGVIERFWFDSARSGGLLMDRLHPNEAGARYERYETMTGAESWMIREISATPIRVRGVYSGGPNPDWRVTPDAESGAWRIEHRQDGRWSTVCEFLIEVGRCVPRPEAPPPQVTEAPPKPSEPEVAPGGVFRIPAPAGLPTAPPAKTPPKKPPA